MATKIYQEFSEKLASEFTEAIRKGTAPWQKTWKAGELQLPYNVTTGKRYNGLNVMRLLQKPYIDQSWLTAKQAKDMGYYVRKGEKGTPIGFFSFVEEKSVSDSENEAKHEQEDKLTKPLFVRSYVFNTTQIDNFPKQARPAPKWEISELAEVLVTNSGAKIFHDQRERAFYSHSKDEIHLPPKDLFKTQEAYYTTLLHELVHWTGHKDRLNRETSSFGTEVYAKEELIAEMGSVLIAAQLGIAYDLQNHASYVDSWMKAIENDPYIVARSAKEAEKILDYVMSLTRIREQELSNNTDINNTHIITTPIGRNENNVQRIVSLLENEAKKDLSTDEVLIAENIRVSKYLDNYNDIDLEKVKIAKEIGKKVGIPIPEINWSTQAKITINNDEVQKWSVRVKAITSANEVKEILLKSDFPTEYQASEFMQKMQSIHALGINDPVLRAFELNSSVGERLSLDDRNVIFNYVWQNMKENDLNDILASVYEEVMLNPYTGKHMYSERSFYENSAKVIKEMQNNPNPSSETLRDFNHYSAFIHIPMGDAFPDLQMTPHTRVEINHFEKEFMCSLSFYDDHGNEFVTPKMDESDAVEVYLRAKLPYVMAIENSKERIQATLKVLWDCTQVPSVRSEQLHSAKKIEGLLNPVQITRTRTDNLMQSVTHMKDMIPEKTFSFEDEKRLKDLNKERELLEKELDILKKSSDDIRSKEKVEKEILRVDQAISQIYTGKEIEPQDVYQHLLDLHLDAADGYSPMESWQVLQRVAAKEGYYAYIEHSNEKNEDFVIHYYDQEHNKTLVKTSLMGMDGKLFTSVNNERISMFISNDFESIQSDLQKAFMKSNEIQQKTLIDYQRNYVLAVTPEERKEVKALGGKWDRQVKCWFIPENVSQDKFEDFTLLKDFQSSLTPLENKFIASLWDVNLYSKGVIQLSDEEYKTILDRLNKHAGQLFEYRAGYEYHLGVLNPFDSVKEIESVLDEYQDEEIKIILNSSFDKTAFPFPEENMTKERALTVAKQLVGYAAIANIYLQQTLKEKNRLEPAQAYQEAREVQQQKVSTLDNTVHQYIKVPYEEKEAAQALGARWDKEVRSWYIPQGIEQTLFNRWEKQNLNEVPISPEEEFKNFLIDHDVIDNDPDYPILLNGQKHRCKIKGDTGSKRSGEYVFYPDGRPAGSFRNFRTGEFETWKYSRTSNIAAQEYAKLKTTITQQKNEKLNNLIEKYDNNAKHLNNIKEKHWKELTSDLPYHEKKGIKPKPDSYVASLRPDTLIIPAYDINGNMRTAQYINADGSKFFAKDTQKEGCFHVVSDVVMKNNFNGIDQSDTLIFCEGYATAGTLAEVLQHPVISVFDSNNMEKVVTAFHEKFPDKPILICGDDDTHLLEHPQVKKNVGQEKAQHVAKIVDGVAIFPQFAKGEQETDRAKFTDFNDLAVNSVLGRKAVAEQVIEGCLKAAELRNKEVQQTVEVKKQAGKAFK